MFVFTLCRLFVEFSCLFIINTHTVTTIIANRQRILAFSLLVFSKSAQSPDNACEQLVGANSIFFYAQPITIDNSKLSRGVNILSILRKSLLEPFPALIEITSQLCTPAILYCHIYLRLNTPLIRSLLPPLKCLDIVFFNTLPIIVHISQNPHGASETRFRRLEQPLNRNIRISLNPSAPTICQSEVCHCRSVPRLGILFKQSHNTSNVALTQDFRMLPSNVQQINATNRFPLQHSPMPPLRSCNQIARASLSRLASPPQVIH